MPAEDLVVIGASAGGVEALTRLVARLPRSLDAAVLVVLHMAPDAPSSLPEVLGRSGPVPAAFARDGEPLTAGTIAIAPPGAHLLVLDGAMALSTGPTEHGQRPAIDPLFRSAAEAFGQRTTGVILSGSLDDGVAGLGRIVEAGGRALVQDPDDAVHPSMPSRALERVKIDAVRPADRLAGAIVEGLDRKVVSMPATREPDRGEPPLSNGAESGAIERNGNEPDIDRLQERFPARR
jgi:two-component system, chemotaxis family, protein-glutamate methylesterase/glutaminase